MSQQYKFTHTVHLKYHSLHIYPFYYLHTSVGHKFFQQQFSLNLAQIWLGRYWITGHSTLSDRTCTNVSSYR